MSENADHFDQDAYETHEARLQRLTQRLMLQGCPATQELAAILMYGMLPSDELKSAWADLNAPCGVRSLLGLTVAALGAKGGSEAVRKAQNDILYLFEVVNADAKPEPFSQSGPEGADECSAEEPAHA